MENNDKKLRAYYRNFHPAKREVDYLEKELSSVPKIDAMEIVKILEISKFLVDYIPVTPPPNAKIPEPLDELASRLISAYRLIKFIAWEFREKQGVELTRAFGENSGPCLYTNLTLGFKTCQDLRFQNPSLILQLVIDHYRSGDYKNTELYPEYTAEYIESIAEYYNVQVMRDIPILNQEISFTSYC